MLTTTDTPPKKIIDTIDELMKKKTLIELPEIDKDKRMELSVQQYHYFSSLSIEKRREIVFINYLKLYPDSLLSCAIVTGKYPVPKGVTEYVKKMVK